MHLNKFFFGLIFVSFGPCKIFPNKYPPISEAIHPIKIIQSIIFKPGTFEKKKKIKI